MGRPPCCEKVGIKVHGRPKKISFSSRTFNNMGPAIGGLLRCSKSCRLRWTNYLRPGIKRGNFTPQEEAMIVHLQALLGNKWAAIASYLPQRTDNDIKNYWNTHLKKKLKKLHSAAVDPPESGSSQFQTEPPPLAGNISASTYASSTENISRLLQGWMRSSPAESRREIGGESSAAAAKQQPKEERGGGELVSAAVDTAAPPISFLEKWLFEEGPTGQVEEMIELSPVF